jgi:hypothetical protein
LRGNIFYRVSVARIIKAPLIPNGHLTTYFYPVPLKPNLHSPERRLIELRMEHGDLDALIDQAAINVPKDELMMRRLKKKRLALRDEIARVEREIDPNESA